MELSYDTEELSEQAFKLLKKRERLDLWIDAVVEIEESEGECDLSALIEDLCVRNPEKISFKVYQERDKNAPRNH
jgi:hypothetical protein